MVLQTNIIAVGGGKGGIGKSILCTNLAVGMALCGKNVVLMDTDFGASNLHALLGVDTPPHGFGDFFHKNSHDPESLLLDTGIRGLKFVCGAGDNPGSANLNEKNTAVIADFIRNLDADFVFLDLAPGTSHNVIDFFNLCDTGLVITTPEITSVMKTFSFIRAALFRRISKAFAGNPGLQRLVDHSNPANADIETSSIRVLKDKLLEQDPDQLHVVESIVNSFKPGLIVNRVRYKKDLVVGGDLIQLVKKYLDVETDYLGYLIESDRVRDSVDEMVPFLIQEPESAPSQNLQKIIGALTHTDLKLIQKDGEIFISQQAQLFPDLNT